MKKLNFEEYLGCMTFIDNPIKLYDYLREDNEPSIDEMTEDDVTGLTLKITEYLDEQITVAQQISIGIAVKFHIPYYEVLKLPKEVGAYLMALEVIDIKKAKAAEPEKLPRPTIADQIATAKGSPQSPTPKIKPEQIADFLRAIGIGI